MVDFVRDNDVNIINSYKIHGVKFSAIQKKYLSRNFSKYNSFVHVETKIDIKPSLQYNNSQYFFYLEYHSKTDKICAAH